MTPSRFRLSKVASKDVLSVASRFPPVCLSLLSVTLLSFCGSGLPLVPTYEGTSSGVSVKTRESNAVLRFKGAMESR